MSQPLRIRLYLSRHVQNSLSLVKTEFWDQDARPAAPASSIAADKRSGLSDRTFPWNNGSRGLAVLLLRHFAAGSPGWRLDSNHDELAKPLVEILGDACDGSQQQTWIQRIFKPADWKPTCPLPRSLLNGSGNTHTKEFWCILGADWAGANVEVFLENRPQPPSEWWAFTNEMEGVNREPPVPPPPAPSLPLTATLDLLVWRPELHDCLSVREPGARPLRAGDGVRVEAKVTSGADAHLYLVWLTLEARHRRHAPFHPWNNKWDEFDRAKDIPRPSLALPENRRETWPMNAASGLETIVLLLRRYPLSEELLKALPGEFDAALASVKAKPNLNNDDFLHEFVHPDETIAEPPGPQVRLPNFFHPLPIADPIYELTCALRDKLGARFDLIRTLTVANVGKERIH